jgi:Flp pilus assembly protein TadD
MAGVGLRPRGVAAQPEFHLHPHYREQTPLEAAMRITTAGLDDFIAEKYHDGIAAIMAEWRTSLLESPRDMDAIGKSLAPGFSGASMRPDESRLIRTGASLEVRRLSFGAQPSLGSSAFLDGFRFSLSGFSKLMTAEFQVTRIDALAGSLRTQVRYEFVGTGDGFHREQRVGVWEIEWESGPTAGYRVSVWRVKDETRSRSAALCYTDVSGGAFGINASYSAQLLRGIDYWRTVLDGACGIDIYGHNGVSVGDIDGDGFDDLYVCQPAGLPNRLFRNRGDGTFEDITEKSGVGMLENTACALFIDVDNDGRQDLVVVRANGPLLFLNQGGGKFRLKPDAFRFATAPQGTFTGAAAADYDRDGWLDIYFCLYVFYQGADQYKYPVPYYDARNGPPNFLMSNNRDGTFRDVTAETGLDKNNTRYSFCCGWSDYNRDGWPDLYVVNDFGRKNLYRNNGDGTFTDVADEAGVEDVGAGMSVGWFDYDNDGAEDLYSADMWTSAGERIVQQEAFKRGSPEQVRAQYRKHAMGNSLFRNVGKGAFQDATKSSGVGIGRWSWSSDAWDFDHDGFPDLYVVNGMLSGSVRDDLNSYFWRQVVAHSPDEFKPSQKYEQGWQVVNELIRADHTWSGFERNMFYANNRDGSFSDVSGAVDLDFLEDGRAFALSDFDHDGRQEVFVKNRNAPQLRLLRNVMEGLPPSIAILLRGRKSNRDAIGASVTVETELGRQTKMLQAGSGFLSQHSKEVFFGVGAAKGPVRVTIRWPSGLVQRLDGLPVHHRIFIEEGLEQHRAESFRPRISGSSRLSGVMQESERFPATAETWLLAPISAPDFSLPDLNGRIWTLSSLRGKTVLLSFRTAIDEDLAAVQGLQLLVVNFNEGSFRAHAPNHPFPVLRGTDDVAAIYNILYRYLFDRHRDLVLPTSFLIDQKGDIVKVYTGRTNTEQVARDCRNLPQTAAERLAKALPFAGVSATYEYERNYLSYGSAFFQRGYFEQAGTFFGLALRDDPSSAEAHYGMGSVSLKLEKVDQARQSFERATKVPASYPETRPNAFNNLGILATRDGHTNEAIVYFQEALRLNPEHLIALENLGNAYRQQRRWEEARQLLERALAVGPQEPEVHYSLAMVFAQTGDTERAYQHLRKALELRPTYPEALNNLGVLYLRTQRRDEAVVTFEECIRVAPAFDQSYLNLARVHSLEGHPEKSRTVLRELLKQHPDHVEGRKALEKLP